MSNTLQAIKERESKVLMSTYGRYPLSVARAEGSRLYDLDGMEYVDLLAGIAVCNLGHCRPELNQAMAEQAGKLIHCSNLFYQEAQLDLAEKLLATCNAGKVFFANSGAESNEGAIKLARRYMRTVKKREAYEIITLSGSFHGRTLATLTATGQAGRIKDGFAPFPTGFTTVPFNDLRALRNAVTAKTAAVMIEMIQGEGGIRPQNPEYMAGLMELVKEKDILLIVDEVQSGMGRTGKYWAHQHYGITPDIFTSAKALGNGLPIGAVLATDEAAKGFEPGSHATTFGGGAMLSAVACKVLDIMAEENLPERAAKVGEHAVERLGKVKAAHPGKIANIRGMGLMLGVELAFPGQKVWKALLERGFVLNLTQERVLRLVPALTIDESDLDAFADTLSEVLAEIGD